MSEPLIIRCREHGPLVIEAPPGTILINDHQGNPYTLPLNKPVIALCRCGHSARKPFCDGAHKTCGFEANNLAVPPAPVDPPVA
jgi:CDGSH iron-sulfur domain-containing protein 3